MVDDVPPVPAPTTTRMGFAFELVKDAFGDVVIAAPVGSPFGKGELIHVVTVKFTGQTLGLFVNLATVINQMTFAAIKGDLIDLLLRGRFRHHGNEAQAKQTGKIGF